MVDFVDQIIPKQEEEGSLDLFVLFFLLRDFVYLCVCFLLIKEKKLLKI